MMLNAASQTISWTPFSKLVGSLSSHKPSRSAVPSNQWRSRLVDFLFLSLFPYNYSPPVRV